MAVVFGVAADPHLEPIALVAAFRRPVEDRVVAHQELDPAAARRIGLVDRPVVENEDAETETYETKVLNLQKHSYLCFYWALTSGSWAPEGVAATVNGKVTVKTAPPPGPEAASTFPLCSRRMALEMLRPTRSNGP